MALVLLASVVACHAIAKRRGRNRVFWGAMGLLFGPLAIPFALLARPKRREWTLAQVPLIGSDARRPAEDLASEVRIR